MYLLFLRVFCSFCIIITHPSTSSSTAAAVTEAVAVAAAAVVLRVLTSLISFSHSYVVNQALLLRRQRPAAVQASKFVLAVFACFLFVLCHHHSPLDFVVHSSSSDGSGSGSGNSCGAPSVDTLIVAWSIGCFLFVVNTQHQYRQVNLFLLSFFRVFVRFVSSSSHIPRLRRPQQR